MPYAIAYACILLVALLPYLWTSLAKKTNERYDNHDPRGWQARQSDPRSQRAYAAHLNGFEVFPAFAAAVLMAQVAGVSPPWVAVLAVVVAVARVLHGLFYVRDIPTLRSLAWLVGMLPIWALMTLAALRYL